MQNTVILTGRLTHDVALKQIANGTTVCSFALAVQRDFKHKHTGEYGVDYIDCVAWRQSAEFIARYGEKGAMVQVQGRLEMEDWTDKLGNKRRGYKVQVVQVYLVGARKSTSDQSPNQGTGQDNYLKTNTNTNVRDYGGIQEEISYVDEGNLLF